MGLITALLVVLLDQGSKYLVRTRMTEGLSIPIIKNFFYLTYIRNPGAAFGMLAYRTQFFVLISLVVVAVIAYYYRKVPRQWVWLRLALGMQAGGAVGNMIDRIRYGRVIDFLDFRVWSYIFNLADTAIVIGTCILALYLIRNSSQSKTEDAVENRQSEG